MVGTHLRWLTEDGSLPGALRGPKEKSFPLVGQTLKPGLSVAVRPNLEVDLPKAQESVRDVRSNLCIVDRAAPAASVTVNSKEHGPMPASMTGT